MQMSYTSLSHAARAVLTEPDPHKKAEKTHDYVRFWRQQKNDFPIGLMDIPDIPARLNKPELRPPNEMPKRRKAGTTASKIALLHALAHIELNAIDLAWDILARFAPLSEQHVQSGDYALPRGFFDDWCKVADDEAKHFLMLSKRLKELGAKYGDLPAHGGLWDASQKTAHDFTARLAIVPMVLEARGLDVTPAMIKNMRKFDDHVTADLLQIIHDDEITHVAAGTTWFKHWCDFHETDVEAVWQDLVRKYFNGPLKRPFNDPSRIKAGMIPDWYEPLAEALRDE